MLSLLGVSVAVAGDFDGREWNVSSGNASTYYILNSPVGANPTDGFYEPAPDDATLKRLKSAGLVAYEDYVAWGAVERAPGQWDWSQHDRMEKAMHAAGLKYVVYTWLHFSPVWLRDNQKADRTLMRCLEHGQEANYLSIFDPRTIDQYDHFYKNLKAHFGDRVDDVYACILGPYGEGNYPLLVPHWVNMGHCHEGWWAGDEYATRAFIAATKAKYRDDVASLNQAWGTSLKSFDDVRPPKELSEEKFKPSPAAFPTPQDKRRWLDFITWYHQSLVNFAERSVQTVLKYFPKEKVRIKPGGTSHGINPITYGTDSPAFAKMLGKYGIVSQPADCIGAPFADKWLATAYQFYNVPLCTEPSGSLDRNTFLRRMFSDASCGARQLFTYEFEQHVPEIQQYVHLYTGQPGETEVAVFCPTTLHRLGGDLSPTIQAGYPLRDFCEYDVLDELLIQDGILKPDRYKVLLIFQADNVEQSILDALVAYHNAGGKIILVGNVHVRSVEGNDWSLAAKLTRTAPMNANLRWLSELEKPLAGLKGVDGAHDGLWTCRRAKQTFVFNWTEKPIRKTIDGVEAEVSPRTIWIKPNR
jgi:hypothetical protein